MFTNAHLSISNYDSLLNSWSKLDLLNDVDFDAGSSKFCQGEDAKNLIMSGVDDNWNIIDGGKECNYYIDIANEVSIISGEQDITLLYLSPESQDVSYGISTTADGDKFKIENGMLKFRTSQFSNSPTDRNSDNIYRVQIYACDNDGDDMCMSMDYKTIKVKVIPKNNATLVPAIMYLLN